MADANRMVLRLHHLNGVHPGESLTRTHQPGSRCGNRSDTLQPFYARGDVNMPGMEDEIDPLKGLDHLGWWLRTHGWDVGVRDQANLHTGVEAPQLWSVSQMSQGSATASWSHQKWNPTCSA